MTEVPVQHSSAQTAIAKKIASIIDSSIDTDQELLEAIRTISSLVPSNTVESRRNLKNELERRALSTRSKTLDSLGAVRSELDNMYSSVSAMSKACSELRSRLKAAKEETHTLIEQSAQLQTASDSISMQQALCTAFLTRFDLTAAELAALAPPDPVTLVAASGTLPPLQPEFFSALKRAQTAHADCAHLLRTSNNATGIQLMEHISQVLEGAYQRLHRWTQQICRAQTGETPDFPPPLVTAMAVLQERRVLFRYVLEEYAAARRAAVVRSFLAALSGVGGMRPIEQSAHDSLRYAGDMLAALHLAAASENDLLESLLKKCPTTKEIAEARESALEYILEGACRPLRLRIEQLMSSGSREPITLLRVASLMRFYERTLRDVIYKSQASAPSMSTTGSASAAAGEKEAEDDDESRAETGAALAMSVTVSVLSHLKELEALAFQVAISALNILATKCLEKAIAEANSTGLADLSPPASLLQLLGVLQEVLSSDASATTPVPRDRHLELIRSICAIVDRVLQQLPTLCSSALPVTFSSNARPVGGESNVCLINSLLAVRNALSTASALYSSASDTSSSSSESTSSKSASSPLERLIQVISDQLEAEVTALVGCQFNYLLNIGGIHVLYATLLHLDSMAAAQAAQHHHVGEPTTLKLIDCPNCDPANISLSMRRLDSLLSSPDQSVLPAVTQLQTRSAVLASRVQQLSLRQFVDVYARLYERIASELAADPAAVASLLPRTPLSVAHLLLVEADPIPIPNPPVESESQSSVQLPPQPLEASITNQL